MFSSILRATDRQQPLIIAELGAKYAPIDEMVSWIDTVKNCGADYVKFQTYRAETISTPGSFFTMEDGSQVSQFDFFKRYELSMEDHERLIAACRDVGIGWFSTPSHPDDADLLESFSPCCYKTGSDDITNLPFLRHLAERGRPMLVSTGMCDLVEVARAVEAIFSTGNEELLLFHCVVSYPSKPDDANLKVIETLRQSFGVPIGLSDHTTDEFTSVLATQLGIAAIEKHFTPDHSLELPDHEASLDPGAFRRLTERVRLVRTALGTGTKAILPTEEKWRAAARKSIFTSRSIRKGDKINGDDLLIRRPSDGIHPHHLDLVIGRTARQDIPADALLSWDMV